MAAKLLAAAVAGVLALTVGLAGWASSSPAPACAPLGVGSVAGLDAEQAGNAQLVVAVGQGRGVPARGLLVALMTAMQESTLRNLDHGDRDSLGLFQQRPSAGWGTPAQVRDPAYAAAAFYGGPGSPTPNPGLLDVEGWQGLPLTAAAQAVQRSAYPDAYARWEGAARVWLQDILGGPPAAWPGCQPGEGAARVAIAAAGRWLGTPYAWGGGDLEGPTRGIAHGAGTVGFDCSGLTRYAWAQAGVLLPRTAAGQWHSPGVRVPSLAQLQPGDLVFFARNPEDPGSIHHVALALGGDAMLEAPRTGDVVKVTTGISANAYWAPQFAGGLRPTP